MRKRILSILLCLVMVVGLFPTMAFAADGSGATTGSGTAIDPYIVTTFEELKAELEKDTVGLGMQYIKVPKGTDIEAVLKLDAFASAIEIQRQKTLIVDGTVTVTGAAAGSRVVRSLLHLNGSDKRLDIKGKGSLTFEANSNGATNAVVDVENDATVNISGGVKLTGAYNLATYGIAVYNYGGTVNIDNATLEGKTGGVSYGAAIFAIKGTTNIKNATLKSSVLSGANITEKGGGTIFIDEDATLTIENSIIHTTDGVTDGHSIYLHQGNTKHISAYLGTNQKIYKLSDDTPLSADVSSLTDSVNITDDISKEIDTVSLTISRSMLNTISDFEHISYAPYNRMKLNSCIVYKGLGTTSDKIKDDTLYDPHQDYTVMYTFEARPSYSFADTVKNQVSVAGGDFWQADNYGGGTNKLRVFVKFPAASAAGQVVKTVTIQVKPKAERTTLNDFNCQSYTPDGSMGNPGCMIREGLNTDGTGSTPTAYDKTKDYSVIYLFPINPGCTIAEDISTDNVTINDGQVYKVESNSKGDTLYVYVNFPAASAAGQVVKTVTIQVKPKAERTKLEDFNCQSYTPTGGMGNPARFLREGLNTDGSGSTPTAYDKDKDYSVVYQFPINPGYTIAEGISTADVTINDGQVWKVSSDSDGKNLLVYVNFPAKAAEDPNYVTEAAVQVAAPVAGEKPSFNGITVTSSNADKIKKALVFWSDTSTPFVAGQEYSATVYLEPKEGVTFADDMKLNVNGKAVDLLSKDPDGSVQFKVMFTAVAPSTDPNYVTEAAVQVAAPVAGEKPKGTVDIPVLGDNKDKVKKAMMFWSGMLSGNTAFEAGQEYTAIVYLEPKEGVTFADDMKLNVNGKAVDLLSKDPDGSVQFKVMFTAVAPSAPTKPAITTVALPDGKVGDAYNQTLAATGTNPITWGIEAGTLPDGLTLVGDTIKGTPSKAGDFKFTVKATNGGGSDTKELTIKVADAEAAKYHNVTLSGAGTGATGAGSHAEGTTVNIYAGTKSGYTFNGWTSDDVTVLSASSKNASFVMPGKDVTVKANWVYNGGGSSGGGYTYYTIKATAGVNGSISPTGNVSVREGRDQTFTITPNKGYAVAKVLIDSKNVGAVKSYTFENVKKNHTIEVVFMKASGNPQTGVFVDVPEGSYYEEAVNWAVEKGITTGTDATHFSPDGICTRAQAVTFLWRAAGSPAAKSAVMPFTDVKAGSYYYDAVLWAVENGITKGTSDTMFSPDATCSRAQIVTFLWRSQKSPAAGTANPFTDVKASAYYADAVLWAVKEDVTKGTTNTTFSPDANCTRAQIVTFIWRALAE